MSVSLSEFVVPWILNATSVIRFRQIRYSPDHFVLHTYHENGTRSFFELFGPSEGFRFSYPFRLFLEDWLSLSIEIQNNWFFWIINEATWATLALNDTHHFNDLSFLLTLRFFDSENSTYRSFHRVFSTTELAVSFSS